MDHTTIEIIVLTTTFIGLMLIRVPISLCIIFSTLSVFLMENFGLDLISHKMIDGLNNYALLTIPFFILAGQIMGEGGLAKRLIRFALLGFGRFKGGLAMVNCLACLMFGNISGSASADMASVGTVMIPQMVQKGYSKEFATSLTISASVQGVVVPPSHNLILYALAYGAAAPSINALFMAGVLPGLVICAILMFASRFLAIRKGYIVNEVIAKEEYKKTIVDGIFSIMPCVIILGGIFSGWFTATEAGAIACLYAFIITLFFYKDIPLKDFWLIILKTLRICSLVFFLMAASSAFSYVLTILRIPDMITQLLLGISSNPLIVLFIMACLLILMSAPMDMAPLIMIMTPILKPVLINMHIDPIHFGIIMMLSLGIGLTIPPHGSVLFIGCALTDTPIGKAVRNMLPFYFILFACLMVIIYVPQLSLWLPQFVH
jgi:tripartite ATP-independent transporter DctM subunit